MSHEGNMKAESSVMSQSDLILTNYDNRDVVNGNHENEEAPKTLLSLLRKDLSTKNPASSNRRPTPIPPNPKFDGLLSPSSKRERKRNGNLGQFSSSGSDVIENVPLPTEEKEEGIVENRKELLMRAKHSSSSSSVMFIGGHRVIVPSGSSSVFSEHDISIPTPITPSNELAKVHKYAASPRLSPSSSFSLPLVPPSPSKNSEGRGLSKSGGGSQTIFVAGNRIVLQKSSGSNGSITLLDMIREQPILKFQPTYLSKIEDEVFIPSCNPFVAHSVALNKTVITNTLQKNPEEGLFHLIPSLYCSKNKTEALSHFKPKSSDVVIASFPRAGQFPILKAVDFMINQCIKDFSDASLIQRVECIEVPGEQFRKRMHSKEKTLVLTFLIAFENADRRLFRTHLDLQSFLSPYPTEDDPKVVVVLRDPISLRISWANHLKQIQHFCKLPSSSSTLQKLNDFLQLKLEINQKLYEEYFASVLSYSKRPNVFIVFYEEISQQPLQLAENLANFLRLPNEAGFTKKFLQTVPLFAFKPISRKRSDEEFGNEKVSISTFTKLQYVWDSKVAIKYKFSSYAEVFERFSKIQLIMETPGDISTEGKTKKKKSIAIMKAITKIFEKTPSNNAL